MVAGLYLVASTRLFSLRQPSAHALLALVNRLLHLNLMEPMFEGCPSGDRLRRTLAEALAGNTGASALLRRHSGTVGPGGGRGHKKGYLPRLSTLRRDQGMPLRGLIPSGLKLSSLRADNNFVTEKGKPVARRRRKARGSSVFASEIARLPKAASLLPYERKDWGTWHRS